ncbi:Predicted metal-dependent peptidase [Loktanella atrilutea]|uniref:Predicted metal-dependent peptidase n=1 Tax=Loktanella atrilutea TaxID=366533 RepID=A0A1M5DU97_LOKAT|nr:VWA-like domain-containing protein [Loktanella atrilutea]SHF70529.1 Predicted metal-dependent peptidase [Loktanella atrilutea]
MSGRHSARARPALVDLAEADPALAALALWCDHRDGATTGTAGTVITYGPDFEALPRHVQIGLAAHHVLHVALRHSARMGDLQARHGDAFRPDLFNLAADALVNTVLLAADHALPRPAVTLEGLLREGLGQAEGGLAEWDVERLYFALLPRGGDEGDRGAAVEDYAERQRFVPDVDPGDATGGGGAAEEAARWQQHLSRAVEAGRAAGRGVGAALHRLADLPEPQTPWNVILRRLLTRAVMPERRPSSQRPARRWIAAAAQAERAGTPVPGFEAGYRSQTDVARVVVGLDASGSIDDVRLGLFWAEVTGIARRMAVELHVAVFDDGLRHVARLAPTESRPVLPEMPRGGGTDFAPVVAHAARLGASALVVLTDLDGPAGPAPRFPVIWAVPDAAGVAAPFGRLVDLSR